MDVNNECFFEQPKQEQGEPVACDNCKKLEDELEHLRIKSDLWKRDAIVWKSAYDVEVGYREQEQGDPVVGTKTWFEDGKIVTQNLYYSDVYTTPQQRTWVGLSVFEINELVENTEFEDYHGLVETVEAKLKEKNT